MPSLPVCELFEYYRVVADGRFLMNLVELKKGEGMYVGADGPHAWLCGGMSIDMGRAMYG